MSSSLRESFDLSYDPPAAPQPPATESPPDELRASFDLAFDGRAIHAAEGAAPPAAPGSPLPPAHRPAPWRRIGEVLALLTLAAVLLIAAIPEIVPPRRQSLVGSAPAPPAAAPGFLSVRLPAAVSASLVRVSLLRYGAPAEAANGERLQQVPLATLARKELPPALYVAQLHYRGEPAEQYTVRVESGQRATLRPDPRDFAPIEYRAGLRQPRGGGDLPYFRRVLRLDPSYVDAHLQLAAYDLLRGRRSSVRRHLDAVRRVAPANRYAARIERLLRRGS